MIEDEEKNTVSSGDAPQTELPAEPRAEKSEVVAPAPDTGAKESDETSDSDSYFVDGVPVSSDDSDVDNHDPTAVHHQSKNEWFRKMMDVNFLEYASYVIKDRAIPDVDDGLKPVQRRILWALYQVHDGRTHKVANIVGNTMHYHPHGNASIEDALVVLANKEYYILKQGNFGNILTGSPAAAGRYTECSLSQLGYEVLFNNDITEFVDSYDGRNVEPVVLPVKIPSLLMLGSDGIAVGMATKIMPHNFNELMDAEIAALRGEAFQLFPDFQQGGLMDVREYADGNGRIVLRGRIEIDGRELVIREIPATTTTESLVASIEKAAEKNKIKISAVNDYTTDKVEIRVVPTRGYDPEKTLSGLFMYTDCSVSISVNLTVIRDNRPVQMSVTEVIRRNAEKLLVYLKRELEIDLGKQNELFHAKTLAQIFFENRIYKRIEECRTQEEEYREVRAGLEPFLERLRREVTDPDIDKLLALPVRRISRFDIEKNERELAEIEAKIAEINKHLGSLKRYAIGYLEEIKKKYGSAFPRRTEIEHFEKIDRSAAALNNIKVGWDRKGGYVGTAIKSDDLLSCNEFDRFLCVEKSGKYKVIALPPEKLFVGKLYDFRRYDANTVFGVIYREVKSGKLYGKRSAIGGFIMEKEYQLCPDGCKIELLTPRSDAIYKLIGEGRRGKEAVEELNLMTLPQRTPKARGIVISGKITKITHSRYLSEAELSALQSVAEPEAPEESEAVEVADVADVAEVAEVAEEPVPAIEPSQETLAEPLDVELETVDGEEDVAASAPQVEPEISVTEPPSLDAPSSTPAVAESEEALTLEAAPDEKTHRERKPRKKKLVEPVAEKEDSASSLPADAVKEGAEEAPEEKSGSDEADLGIVQPELFGF